MAIFLRSVLTEILHQQWQYNGWLAKLLRPLSALAAWHVRRKHQAYRDGRRPAWRAPVPVIVIGNIYVGGTGKTPVTIAIVQALQARGWQPGVISRGYGVDVGPVPRCGQAPLPATEFGDEPALIAAATQAPIAVHPNRPLAAAALLAQWPQTDILICDDGLQHLALQRDIEIVVQDERGVGNGLLLPAGPLREPPARLQSVTAVITNRNTKPLPVSIDPAAGGPLKINMSLRPERFEHLASGRSLSPDAFMQMANGRPLAAVAGIGNPARFFHMLRHYGLRATIEQDLPDHYAYTHSPFTHLAVDHIVITSKDATKCRALDDSRLWIAHATPHFDPPDWLDALLAQLPARP